MKKLAVVLMLAVVFTITLTGCSKDKGNQETTAGQVDLSSNSEVAINAGGIGVLTDEVRYYAYTAQATYEAYYISGNKNMDRKSDMKKGVSWQEGVKSIVLDDICRREYFCSLAKKYDVQLSDSDEDSVKAAVNDFFEESDSGLVKKIDIKRQRLIEVFEKQKIQQRVESNVNSSDDNAADNMYKKWKKANTVTAGASWDEINFNEHIFTLEDAK